MWAVLRQRNFGLLWFGQSISLTGDWLLFIALPFYVYNLTGSTLATGAMFAAQLLPSLLFGSVAGVFADRWDRRRMMIAADVLRALVLLLLLVVRSADELWLIYLVAFGQAVIGQFFAPAKNAIIPQLVGERDLLTANSLNSVSDSLTRLIGPSLGGVLFAWFGLTSVVLADAASFLVSALMIALIAMPARTESSTPRPTGKTTSLWRDWMAGLRLVRDSRLLAGLFVVLGIATLADGLLTSLLVPFMKDIMHAGTQEFGLIIAAQGVGGLLGGLLIGRVSKRVSPWQWIVMGSMAAGVFDALIFNFPSLLFAMTLIVPAGIMIVGMFVSANTLLQQGASDEYRGRVFGAFATTMAMMRLIGIALASVGGDRIGLLPLLNLSAVCWVLAGIVTLFALRDSTQRPAVPALSVSP